MFSPAPDAPLPVNANNAAVTQEDKLEFSNKADDNKEEIIFILLKVSVGQIDSGTPQSLRYISVVDRS
jgi:hypothetical protein